MTTVRSLLLAPLTLLVVAGLGGCQASVGTNGAVSVPRDAGAQCASQCGDIGMGLDSVVIMANTVGCVCRPGGTAAPRAASAAGGMTAVMMAEAENRKKTP